MKMTYKIIALLLIAGRSFAQDKLLFIDNINIVDVVSGKIIKEATVEISGNRIKSINSKNIRNQHTTVIDAKGKYLIPGLWDMHTHSLRKERLGYFFPLFIANGVTGIRDMASDMDLADILKLRSEIEESNILGPRLGAVTGKILDGPPRPDTTMFTYPADTTAAKQMVQSYKRQKADFIKVYNMLAKDIYLAIASESKNSNIHFTGHVPFSVTAAEASEIGQRSIEHLSDILISVATNEFELRNELAASKSINAIQSSNMRMEINFKAAQSYNREKALALFSTFVRNETWQCPTLRNLQIVTTHADVNSLMNDPRVKYFPASVRENWKRILSLRITGDSTQRAVFFQQTLKLVADMHAAGVKLLAGTDLASNFLMPGFSLHDELGLMVEAGLSPLAALQTATINPALFLGLNADMGTVEKGKLADLVLLDANPLENINNIRKIHAVIINGKLLQRTDLDSMLAQVEIVVNTAVK
jgi:hypothetical protein